MSFLPNHDDHDKRDDLHEHALDDDDTASQRSISLSSPSDSKRNSYDSPSGYGGKGHAELLAQLNLSPTMPESNLTNLSLENDYEDGGDEEKQKSIITPSASTSTVQRPYSSDFTETETDNASMFTRLDELDSPNTSVAPSILSFKDLEVSRNTAEKDIAYPPQAHRSSSYGDTSSITSASSAGGKKARPESVLLPHIPEGKLILGIALVDFNHLEGPKIEYSRGDIFEDEEIAKMLPFLALPDGAHLSSEDYSYFHIVPTSSPNPTTIFGISCNQQIASSALLVRMPDVTRSTVQKAVVVLASKPVFGPIRDKLGVITTALFQQRDFSSTQILDDFSAALEPSLRGQLTESGLYMGTSLRSLVQTFRHRTLILVKALIIQRRIMFTSHPVERLCTFQYSLVSLLPELLQTLDDCGSPPLNARSKSLEKPTELKTSDPRSMRRYLGLPLDIFGKDAFFQPYLPLQQLDMLKDTKSWLCGSTNSIVSQQKEVDILVNAETGAVDFHSSDSRLESKVGLTPADRKWMDDILRDVNESREGEFTGSDDYLRAKFEEYIFAALSAVRYRDFLAKHEGTGVVGGTGAEAASAEDFNPLWIAEFKHTNAYEVWDRTTDQSLFDIVEPRHPCIDKPSIVSDIGLRFQEGIQDLKLDQQLAPAREAVSRTLTAGSTTLLNAMEGVRARWGRPVSQSAVPASPISGSGTNSPPEVVNRAEAVGAPIETAPAAQTTVFGGFTRPSLWTRRASTASTASATSSSSNPPPAQSTTPPIISESPQETQATAKPASGWGSFVGRFSFSRQPSSSSSHERSESSMSSSLVSVASRDSGPSSTRNSTVSIGSNFKADVSAPADGDGAVSPTFVSSRVDLDKKLSQGAMASSVAPVPARTPPSPIPSPLDLDKTQTSSSEPKPAMDDPQTPVAKKDADSYHDKEYDEPKTPVPTKTTTVVPPVPPIPSSPVKGAAGQTQPDHEQEDTYSAVVL